MIWGDAGIISATKSFCLLFGFPDPAALTGTHISAIFPGLPRPNIDDARLSSFSVVPAIRGDGSRFKVYLGTLAFKTKIGAPRFVGVVARCPLPVERVPPEMSKDRSGSARDLRGVEVGNDGLLLRRLIGSGG